MTEPLVCCVMITNNRPELSRRAVRHFNRQTYKNKLLFVLDTSQGSPCQAATEWRPLLHWCSIGMLRNVANEEAIKRLQPDILINWDDDDVSHRDRIDKQVWQLQTTLIDQRNVRQGITRAQAVGYQDLLWWDSTKSEAWLYENGSNHYCLGTSLCYYPDFWKQNPFPNKNTGEWPQETQGKFGFSSFVDGEPMIIGEWHGNNGANAGTEKSKEPWKIGGECWKRMPEWDERLKARMALESGR